MLRVVLEHGEFWSWKLWTPYEIWGSHGDNMKIIDFWDVTPSTLVGNFEETCCLHLLLHGVTSHKTVRLPAFCISYLRYDVNLCMPSIDWASYRDRSIKNPASKPLDLIRQGVHPSCLTCYRDDYGSKEIWLRVFRTCLGSDKLLQ
jgi:hypothetical protein